MSDTSKMTEEDRVFLTQFVDLLEKALHLNPEKRLSVKEALTHPFLYAGSGRH